MNNSRQAGLSEDEIADTVALIGKFKVAELKDLARSMELRLTGKKQDLNDRIIQFLEQGRRFNDGLKLLTIRTLVLKRHNHDSLPSFRDLYQSIQTGAFNYTSVWNQYSGKDDSSANSIHSMDSKSYKGHSLYFKDSPFYKLKRMVHGSPQVAFPSKGRAVCEYNFVLSQEENELLKEKNPMVQFYLLCGVQTNTSPSSTEVLLQFPNPVEIHINGSLFKENVKGIKGRPGTAKPANLTSYLYPSPKSNKLQMVYTTSNDTYLLYLYVVETIPCEGIIKEIVSRPHIHKESTLSQIYKNAADDDDDLIVSNSVVTLKDPLTYTRISYPTQSIFCTHVECFDGLIFLTSQMQLPTWSCPHCHKTININDLAISDYFSEILFSVSDEVDHVVINQDGSWSIEDTKADSQSEHQTPVTSKTDNFQHKSESKAVIPESIEIVSLDSDSEDEINMSAVPFIGNNNSSGSNVHHQSNGNTESHPLLFESQSNEVSMSANSISNADNLIPSSYVIDDSETDSEDERPLARRAHRPPIISTSPDSVTSNNLLTNSERETQVQQSRKDYPRLHQFSQPLNSKKVTISSNSTNSHISNDESNIRQSRYVSEASNSDMLTAPTNYDTHSSSNSFERSTSNLHNNEVNTDNSKSPNSTQIGTFQSQTTNSNLQGVNSGVTITTNLPISESRTSREDFESPSNTTMNSPTQLPTSISSYYPESFQQMLDIQKKQMMCQKEHQNSYNQMTRQLQERLMQAGRISPSIRDLQNPSEIQNSIANVQNIPIDNSVLPLYPGNTNITAPNSLNNGVHNIAGSTSQLQPLNNRSNEVSKSVAAASVSCTEIPSSTLSESNNMYSAEASQPGPTDYYNSLAPVQSRAMSPELRINGVHDKNDNEIQSNKAARPEGLRYSKSAFDLLGENSSVSGSPDTPPASKKQKIVGLLGISLDNMTIPTNNTLGTSVSHSNQDYQMSPINGRIHSMQLATPEKLVPPSQSARNTRNWNRQLGSSSVTNDNNALTKSNEALASSQIDLPIDTNKITSSSSNNHSDDGNPTSG